MYIINEGVAYGSNQVSQTQSTQRGEIEVLFEMIFNNTNKILKDKTSLFESISLSEFPPYQPLFEQFKTAGVYKLCLLENSKVISTRYIKEFLNESFYTPCIKTIEESADRSGKLEEFSTRVLLNEGKVVVEEVLGTLMLIGALASIVTVLLVPDSTKKAMIKTTEEFGKALGNLASLNFGDIGIKQEISRVVQAGSMVDSYDHCKHITKFDPSKSTKVSRLIDAMSRDDGEYNYTNV